MRIDILSLFPGYFKGPFDESMLKRAVEKDILDINLLDIRDYADNKRNVVDDRPYGGGPGMVMMPGPVVRAIRSVRGEKSLVVHLSPQGKRLDAHKARELSHCEHLVLLCGHYEGIDQRALDLEVDEELSIGDYVLTNGCLSAIVVIDAMARFIPGVLGDLRSAEEDSFEGGILDCPHYTRPVEYEDLAVPEVLRQGNHKEIEKWRKDMAEKKTRLQRPDLFC